MVEEFDSILRFWFDRGIDGFRIDVADSMAKDDTLPDVHDPRVPGQPANKYPGHPHWDRDEVHDIHRRWRRIADEYADRPGGARTFVAEAWVTPPERLARYLRPDELHCAFNFDALKAPWDAKSLRQVIDDSTEAIWDVGASATWVLSNHDTIRHRTRYGRDQREAGAPAGSVASDLALGLRRARAAALLELALPGGAYIYQGDELGLPEVEDLPERRSRRPDLGALRSSGPWPRRMPRPDALVGNRAAVRLRPRRRPSRGCPNRRVGATLTAEAQRDDPASHLSLYRDGAADPPPAPGPRRRSAAVGRRRRRRAVFRPRSRVPMRRQLRRRRRAPCPPHREVLLTSLPLEDGEAAQRRGRVAVT